MRRAIGGMALVAAILVGLLLGLGSVTFRYAEGLSYFSSDPKACVNCHIMRKEYDSWNRSSHHAVAGCVDCHLPSSFVSKWVAKALNGYNHSVAFTLQNFHEPIMIGKRNARILQQNCLNCHKDFVHDIVQGNKTDTTSVKCVQCHVTVGHGSPSN